MSDSGDEEEEGGEAGMGGEDKVEEGGVESDRDGDTQPENKQGSWAEGESPMSFNAAVNMLYQWCGDLRNPYNVLFNSQ